MGLVMYDVPEPTFKRGNAIRLHNSVLLGEKLRLTEVGIIEGYSVLRLAINHFMPSDDKASIQQVVRALERIGIPEKAQRVKAIQASNRGFDVSVEVRNLVECKRNDLSATTLPQGAQYRVIAQQISVPYSYLMMWARLYLYPDGDMPDDDDYIFSRAGSELTKHVPWWERWRPAFLGENAIWRSKDDIVYFDYRLGDHYYAAPELGSVGMTILQPDLELYPILLR